MRRREFIVIIGGTAAAWPVVTYAQRPTMPTIGFINGQVSSESAHLVAMFRQGLNQSGFVEGQNVAIEFRWAEGRPDRVPAFAADLVQRKVAVIVATGGGSLAAMAASTTIPIVGTFGGDPVKLGFVQSLSRPGGNVTGVSIITSELEAKRLQLLHELVPKATLIGMLLDPTFSGSDLQLQAAQAAARALGREIRILNVSSETDMDTAFTTLTQARVGALAVVGNPYFLNRRERLVALAARDALPVIYENREFTVAGGLMSYGANVPDVYRQVGVYTGRILHGERPANLPVQQPTKFELVINLKTAKALGLEAPATLLALADEVIE